MRCRVAHVRLDQDSRLYQKTRYQIEEANTFREAAHMIKQYADDQEHQDIARVSATNFHFDLCVGFIIWLTEAAGKC
jgi:hypothetical protein